MTDEQNPPEEFPDWRPLSRGEFTGRISDIVRRIKALEQNQRMMGVTLMATQADIDALTTALTSEDSQLNTAVAAIQAEITALQNNNPTIDVTALQAAVASMTTAVSAAAALVPATPPAPSGG